MPLFKFWHFQIWLFERKIVNSQTCYLGTCLANFIDFGFNEMCLSCITQRKLLICTPHFIRLLGWLVLENLLWITSCVDVSKCVKCPISTSKVSMLMFSEYEAVMFVFFQRKNQVRPSRNIENETIVHGYISYC